jgi:hypothetical protein
LILVIAALVIGGISITRSAAQAAIPGDALYPVKTTIEQTRLTLAQDAGDRAQMKMAFAEQRLEEIAALIEEGRYREVNKAVLAFEADINSAILELETVSQVDPARAARIALEITAALTRYAQTLGVMAANAPDSVRPEVARALDTAQIVGSLELPTAGMASDDNSNANISDNANDNGDDGNANSNADDDNANANGNGSNANSNGDDSIANGHDDDGGTNANGDDRISNNNGDDSIANANGDDSNANSNGDDGNANANGNDNGNGDDGGTNANGNGNTNTNSNANSNDNGNTNANTNDNSNANGNSNANSNANGNSNDNSNANGNSNDNSNANHNGDD